MAYLGRQGVTAPLTSADIPDSSITAAKIATGAITAADVAADMATQAELDTVSTVASAALPKAGGAMTGAITTNSTFDGTDIAVRDALHAPKASPTFTGTATFSGDIVPSTPLSHRNMIINGGMQVWQRATTTTDVGGSSGVFPAVDRFKVYAGNTAGRLTMSQSTDTPDGFGSSVKFDCTTADASTAVDEEFIFVQPIEGQNLQQMAKGVAGAKSVTLSFYAKGTAKTYGWEFVDHDTGGQRHIANTFTVTTSWQRFSFVIPGDTTGAFGNDNNASASLYFWLLAGSNMTSGTAATSWQALLATERAVGIGNFFDSTSNELFITGVQLELGSNATPFEHRSYGDELQRCYRYCERFVGSPVGSGSGSSGAECFFGTGLMQDVATNHNIFMKYYPKRAAPSMTINNIKCGNAASWWNTITSVGSGGLGLATGRCRFGSSTTNGATYATIVCAALNNDTDSWIQFDAEL